MAGGDLLYIFAFIILPTAVLVSCIWALVLLRRGALLPERRVPERLEAEDTLDESERELDLVEETGEHVVVAPVHQPPPAATAPAAASPVEQPAAAASELKVPPVAVAREVIPTVERTQEMAAVPIADASPEPSPAPSEPIEPAAAGADEPSPVAAGAEDVLIVPLEEPAPRYTNGQVEPQESMTDPAQVAAEAEPETTAATSQRRPARKPVRLRPGDPDSSRQRPRTGQRRTPRREGS